jgi:NADH:ubiquinone oxidoreductase subunit F (NADH-binding)
MMQILRRTNLQGYERAKKLGAAGIIEIIDRKGLTGRGGSGFSAAKKWNETLKIDSDVKYVICNADEGEPGTFKDKFIIENNPEILVEGIIIAAYAIGAKQAFIYLRGEYENLAAKLQESISKVLKDAKSDLKIEIIIGAGAYVCGEQTALIKSIEGFRGHPFQRPPHPSIEGLFGKPTIVNNVETLANVPQLILFDDWDANLRLYSVSGNVTKPGIYEMPLGCKLGELIKLAQPANKPKAIYFGCFGGCMPYREIELTPENVCGMNCAIGSFTIIAVDERHSILDLAENIAEFYCHESCGKCTPCREGTKRILDLIRKIKNREATKEDLETLRDLAEHINLTSLCGLGQTATNHVLTALKYFSNEFEERRVK